MKTTQLISSIRTHLHTRLAADKLRTANSVNGIMDEFDRSVADAAFALIDGGPVATPATAKVAKAGVVKKRHRRTNAEVAAEKAQKAADKLAKADAKEAKKAAKSAGSTPANGETDEQKALREEYEKTPLVAVPTRGKAKVVQSPEAAVAVSPTQDSMFAPVSQ